MLMSASIKPRADDPRAPLRRLARHPGRPRQRHDRHPPRPRLDLRRAPRRTRSARLSIDHAQCGHLDCAPEERALGANLGLYSVTFNNDLAHDLRHARAVPRVPRRGRAQGLSLLPRSLRPQRPGRGRARHARPLPQRHDRADARRRRPGGPAAVPQDRLSRTRRRWRSSSGTTRTSSSASSAARPAPRATPSSSSHDAQKYGAKVALFGRKINNAENQLAFVQFLRLIVDGVIGPVEAVKAYHAVLAKLGVPALRSAGRRPPADGSGDELWWALSRVTVPATVPRAAPLPQRSRVLLPQPSAGPALHRHRSDPPGKPRVQRPRGPRERPARLQQDGRGPAACLPSRAAWGWVVETAYPSSRLSQRGNAISGIIKMTPSCLSN